MENKLTTQKRNKKKIIAFILIMALCLSLIPITSLGAPPTGKNVTELVTLSNLAVNVNGKALSQGDQLAQGSDVYMKINWKIDDPSSIVKNDFFEIELPNVFNFDSSTGKTVNINVTIQGVEEKIGEYELIYQNSKYYMQVVFTKNLGGDGEGNNGYLAITNGYLDATGRVSYSPGEYKNVSVGSEVLPTFTVKPSETPSSFNGFGAPEQPSILKSGTTAHVKNGEALWYVNVNLDNYAKYLNNDRSFTPLEDVVITDNLDEDFIFVDIDKFSARVPLMLFNPDDINNGKVGNYSESDFDKKLTGFELVYQNTGETYDQFYTRLTAMKKPVYGVYDDRKLIISCKNLPNSDLHWFTKNEYLEEDFLPRYNYTNLMTGIQKQQSTENAKRGYARLFVDSDGNPVNSAKTIGFVALFKTKYVGNSTTVKAINTINMSNKTGNSSSSRFSVLITNISGGASALPRQQVEITKYISGSSTVLPGVEFQLEKFDEDTNDYVTYRSPKTTGDDGKVLFTSLQFGDYRILETNTLPGFKPNQISFVNENDEEFDGTFTIAESDDAGFRYKAYNERSLGSVTLTKKASGANGATLTGASFVLKDENGTTYPAILNPANNYKWDDIPWGTYTIEETSAQYGYDKNSFKIKESGDTDFVNAKNFSITISEENQNYELEGTNDKILGSIQLTKYDSVTTDKGLSGAKFALKKKNPSGAWVTYTAIDTQTTNDEGIVVFDKLPIGEYQIVETDAKAGYDKSTFTIKDGNTFVKADKFSVTIDGDHREFELKGYNKAEGGSIKIIKIDGDASTNVLLSGGLFGLVNTDDPTKILATTSAMDGIVEFSGLKWGSYIVEEIEAPEGYVGPLLYSGTFDGTFVIKGDNLNEVKTGKNTRDKGKLTLTKVDASNSKALLSGGEFALLKDGEEAPNYYATTSALNGKVNFTNLEWGEYQLIETKAPTNYDNSKLVFFGHLDKDGKFTVTNGALDLIAEAKNKRELGEFSLEKTDGSDSSKLSGGLFGLLKDGEEAPNYYTSAPAVKGSVNFTDLEWGNYELVEIDAPEGYDGILTIIEGDKEFEITGGALTESAKATNEKAVGQLTIKKYDDKATSTALQGAEFVLLDEKNNITEFTATTNSKGEAVFKDIPWGTYFVQETTPPAGYLPGTLTFENTSYAAIGIPIDQDNKEVEVIAYNSKSDGSITLTKESTDGEALSGAAFNLLVWNGSQFVNSGHGPAITGNNGVVTFAGLEFGQYRIQETSAATGYNKDTFKIKKVGGETYSNWNDFDVTISDTVQSFELVGQNKMLPGSFELTKLDGSDNTVEINGGLFKLSKDGDSDFEATASAVKGKVTFSNLEKGIYTIKEVTAPSGYDGVLDFEDGFDGTFEIKADNRSVKATAENGRILGDFVLTKKDLTSKKLLSGGVFKLTKVGGGYERTSSAINGEVVFDDLDWGTYTVSEVEAPVGYKDGSLSFDAGKTATVIVTKGAIHPTLNGYNAREDGQISMMKLDGTEQGVLLNGGEFKLTKVGGGYESTTSAIDGIVSFSDLKWGDYEITEVTAPLGYTGTLNWSGSFDGIYHVTNSALGVQPLLKTAYNERIQGSLEIEKYDLENQTTPVEGAEFGLMIEDENGWTNFEVSGEAITATTDENGKATFTKLPWNTYKVVELNTPEGYEDNSLTFEAGSDGTFIINSEVQKVTIKAYNKAKKVLGDIAGSVKGEDAYPDAEKVLGDEAKTADPANIVPLLVAMLIICFLMLLILALNSRRE